MSGFEGRHKCLPVLCSGIIVSLLLLSFASEVQSLSDRQYPPQVDVEEVFLREEDWKSRDSLPFINSRDYLRQLALQASLSVVKSAMLVVGPRSSGKSNGLQQIMPRWENLGHIVLDIDLKGRGLRGTVSSQDFMWYMARKVTESFYSLDHQAQECIFDELLHKSVWFYSIYLSKWQSMYSTIFLLTGTFGVGTVALYVFAMLFTGNIQGGVLKNLLLVLSILLMILALVCYTMNWYIVEEIAVNPIQAKIASGDWDALSHSCNAISRCAPEHRPVVILRELANLDSDSLNAFLRSLERMKQGDIHYPVFVESSDFQWMNESPVIKSSDSFIPHHLQEMTREEGLAEVVHRFKIWTEEEYQLIYDEIGGHLGSFSLLYHHNKVQKLSLNESIWHLKKRAFEQVLDTVVRAENCRAAIEDWLVSFRNSGYRVTAARIPEDIWVLFEMNILFRDLMYVYPQNKLLEHAVDDYVSG